MTAANKPTTRLCEPDKHRDFFKIIGRLLSTQTDQGWPSNVQFDLDNIAIEALTKGSVTQHDLLNVLKQMRTNGEHKPDAFDQSLDSYNTTRHRKRHAPSRRWHLLFPFNIELDAHIARPAKMRILGHSFSFTAWAAVLNRMGKARLMPAIISTSRRTSRELQPQFTKTCVAVSVNAADFWSAWKSVESAFDAFRGLMEVTFGLGSTRMSNPQKARRHVPCPFWVVGCAENSIAEGMAFLVGEDDKEANPFQLDVKAFGVLKRNARMTSRVANEGSLRSLLADALRLYSQAMDARFNHECLLGLWQLAEAITLAQRYQGSKKMVCTRLAFCGRFLHNLDLHCLKDSLEWLYEKRNEVVHRGLHAHVQDDDVNILKLCCEAGVTWLSRMTAQLPSENHLDYFYSWVDRSDTDLTTIATVLKRVKRQKAASKAKTIANTDSAGSKVAPDKKDA